MNLIFSERGEKKFIRDDLPALTEIPLQPDSGLEDSFSESPLAQGPFFSQNFITNRFEAKNNLKKYSS